MPRRHVNRTPQIQIPQNIQPVLFHGAYPILNAHLIPDAERYLLFTEDRKAKAAWKKYDAANQPLRRWMIATALAFKAKGNKRLGMQYLIEKARYEYDGEGTITPGEEYKISNDYGAFYARSIMREVPELAGFFEVRECYVVNDDDDDV